ncbi:MAG: hypothetical protein CL917_18150 [Deltaproteobacteria bacterium]|nr:hypothetical protein [Deltaproteobacteria bacterium]
MVQGLNPLLQALAILVSLLYIGALLVALRRSRLSVRQSLLWLSSGFLFLGISVFPEPVIYLAGVVGFVAPSNALMATWLLTLNILILYQSLTTSLQTEQIKLLTQDLSLLQTRLGEVAPGSQGGIEGGARGQALDSRNGSGSR